MKKLFLYSALILLNINLLAQDYQLINESDIKKHIEILASDSLEGRYTGAIGQKKAAEYLAREYEKIGLQTFTENSYFESFYLQNSSWGSVYLKTESEVFYNNDKIAYLGYKAENKEIALDVVFGGYGTKQALDSIKVNGKLVLLFIKNIRTSYKISKELKTRGARGVLLANIENDKQFRSIKQSEGRYLLRPRIKLVDEKEEPYSNEFHKFAISNDIIKDLLKVSVKKLKWHAENGTINNLKSQKINLKVVRKIETISTENVVGVLPGNSDTTIYISAHYDHIGKGSYGIYNGADDNASGTTALLELAELFSKVDQRRYTMVFLAATAEEVGLIGSYVHVNAESFDKSKALVNFNIDMISRIDGKLVNEDFYQENYLYAIGTDIYPKYKTVLEMADKKYDQVFYDYSMNNGKKTPWIYRASDHANFHELGIPAIMFFAGLHDDYHEVTDTPEKIDYQLLKNRITLIAYTLYQLQK